MAKRWIVQMYYQGRVENTERFATREAALEFYNSKVSACRFGLVGWAVSYPREAV